MADGKEKEPTMSDLLEAFNKGNAETKQQLTSLETTIKANQKVVEDYIRSNDEAVKNLQDRVGTLEATVKTLETTVTNLSDEVENLKKNNTVNNQKIFELGKAGKQIDEDRRKANIIVEGLKESKTDHPRQQVKELLLEIGVDIPLESILTASRLGPVTNSRRPRHILVKFVLPVWKQEKVVHTHRQTPS